MSLEIVPYRASHFEGSTVRDIQGTILDTVMSPAYLKWLEVCGPGYSGFVEGSFIGAVVFMISAWPGVAEVAALFPGVIAEHGRVVHRVCKRSIDSVQEKHGIRRIECRIGATETRNRKWAESLGFEPEGVCRSFGPEGQDFVYYARVRE